MLNANFLSEFAQTAGNFGKTVSDVASNSAVQGYGLTALAAGGLYKIFKGMGEKDALHEYKEARVRIANLGSGGKIGSFVNRVISGLGQITPTDRAKISLLSKQLELTNSILDAVTTYVGSDQHYAQPKKLRSLSEVFIQGNRKYNPIYQFIEYITTGRSVRSLQGELSKDNVSEYRKYQDAQEKFRDRGIGWPGYTALGKDSRQVLATADTYQAKHLNLLAWIGDLTRQNTIFSSSMVKAMGVSKYLRFENDIPVDNSLFGMLKRLPQTITDLPGLNALKNIAKTGFNIITAPIRLARSIGETYDRIENSVKNFTSRGLYSVQNREDLEKRTGVFKSIQERADEYIARGLPNMMGRIEARLKGIEYILEMSLSALSKMSNMEFDMKGLESIRKQGGSLWSHLTGQYSQDKDIYRKETEQLLMKVARESTLGRLTSPFRRWTYSPDREKASVLRTYQRQTGIRDNDEFIRHLNRQYDPRLVGVDDESIYEYGISRTSSGRRTGENRRGIFSGEQQASAIRHGALSGGSAVIGGALGLLTGGVALPITGLIGSIIASFLGERKFRDLASDVLERRLREERYDETSDMPGVLTQSSTPSPSSSPSFPPLNITLGVASFRGFASNNILNNLPLVPVFIFRALQYIEQHVVEIYKSLNNFRQEIQDNQQVFDTRLINLHDMINYWEDRKVKLLETIRDDAADRFTTLRFILDEYNNLNFNKLDEIRQSVDSIYVLLSSRPGTNLGTSAGAGAGFAEGGIIPGKLRNPNNLQEVKKQDNIHIRVGPQERILSARQNKAFEENLENIAISTKKIADIQEGLYGSNNEAIRIKRDTDERNQETLVENSKSIVDLLKDIAKKDTIVKIKKKEEESSGIFGALLGGATALFALLGKKLLNSRLFNNKFTRYFYGFIIKPIFKIISKLSSKVSGKFIKPIINLFKENLEKISIRIGSFFGKLNLSKFIKPEGFLGKIFGGIGKLFSGGAGGGIFGKILSKITSFGKGFFKKLPGLSFIFSAWEAIEGYRDASDITGKKNPSFFQKIGAGTASVLSGLTFGLISPKTIYGWMSSAIDALGNVGSKIGDWFNNLGIVKTIKDFFTFDTKGWKHVASDITGKKNPSFIQKMGAGIAGVLSGLTFGLISPKTIYGWMSSAIDALGNVGSKIGDWFNNLGIVKTIKDFFTFSTEGEDKEPSFISKAYQLIKKVGSGVIDFVASIPIIGTPIRIIKDIYEYLTEYKEKSPEKSIISTMIDYVKSMDIDTIMTRIFGDAYISVRDFYNKTSGPKISPNVGSMITGNNKILSKPLNTNDVINTLKNKNKDQRDKILTNFLDRRLINQEQHRQIIAALQLHDAKNNQSVKPSFVPGASDLRNFSNMSNNLSQTQLKNNAEESNFTLKYSGDNPIGLSSDVVKKIKAMIIGNEGFRDRPYRDAGGYSVGIGHYLGNTLTKETNRIFSRNEIVSMFEEDFYKHAEAASKIPNFNKLNVAGKAALIDLTFNMGPDWWKRWPNFTRNMQKGDFAAAILSLKNSKWYNQVWPRSDRTIDLFRLGYSDDKAALSALNSINLNSNNIAKLGGIDALSGNNPITTTREQTGSNPNWVKEVTKDDSNQINLAAASTTNTVTGLLDKDMGAPVSNVVIAPTNNSSVNNIPKNDMQVDSELTKLINNIFAAVPRYFTTSLNEFVFMNRMNLTVV